MERNGWPAGGGGDATDRNSVSIVLVKAEDFPCTELKDYPDYASTMSLLSPPSLPSPLPKYIFRENE